MEKRIQLPLTDAVIDTLCAGDIVYLTGTLYTGRDAAHQRLWETYQKNEPMPVDLSGEVLYYVGPTPARPGQAVGSAGPTSSYRMDAYTPLLLSLGLKGMIGKGTRGPEVVEAIQTYHAVYFAAVGGAAALISKSIVSSEVIAYEDLGPEAIRRYEVVDFPVIVVIDAKGRDLYVEGVNHYLESK